MAELTILVVGNTQRAEFRDAWESLQRAGRLVVAANIDAAEALLADGSVVPDLIVVVQAYPGEFSAEGLDRLRRRAPWPACSVCWARGVKAKCGPAPLACGNPRLLASVAPGRPRNSANSATAWGPVGHCR